MLPLAPRKVFVDKLFMAKIDTDSRNCEKLFQPPSLLAPFNLPPKRKLSQAMIFRALLLPRFVLLRECSRISARFGPWDFFPRPSGGMEKFRAAAAAAAEDSLWSESWMMKVEWVWVSTLLLLLGKKKVSSFLFATGHLGSASNRSSLWKEIFLLLGIMVGKLLLYDGNDGCLAVNYSVRLQI